MNEKNPLSYEYVGGGWFRLKDVPKGQPAPILHGEKFLELVAEAMNVKQADWEERSKRAIDWLLRCRRPELTEGEQHIISQVLSILAGTS